MATFTVRSLKELGPLITRHMNARQKRVVRAARKTARKNIRTVQQNVPRAFGTLEDAIHAVDTETGGQIIADAPHATIVEKGSRPHVPPIKPIYEWVQLRALQAFRSQSPRAKKSRGYAGELAKEQTRMVRRAVRERMKTGAMQGDEIIMDIARAIQFAIGARGTKPHAYMLASLPAVEASLAEMVRAALPDTSGD